MLRSLRYKAEQAASGLPALIAQATDVADTILSGAHTKRRPGTGEKFWQFREYDHSDRPQDIDWRQSAKGDRVYIRQKEWQTSQNTLFWCQNDASMAWQSEKTLPTKQEAASILGLATSMLMTRSGEKVQPLDQSSYGGHTDAAVQKLGEVFVGKQTEPLPQWTSSPQLSKSNLVLIGDFLSPFSEIEKTLQPFCNQVSSALLIQVLDPAELTLPFEGRINFIMPGKQIHNAEDTITEIENAQSVRDTYIEKINNHTQAINEFCRKNQWHWLLHSTNEDYKTTLHKLWNMLTPSLENQQKVL